MELLKKLGEDLVLSVNGIPVLTVKDAPTIPIPQPSTKLTFSIDVNGLHFPGVDGTNLILISNDFAADSPEVALLFLGADKAKVNIAGVVIHYSLDPTWSFETSQKHWTTLMSQATGLKNIPAPVKGSTRKLVKPADGNIDSTVFEQSAGADMIIAKAHQCTTAKPLVIFMGGQSPDVANAYLKDKSIANKVVLFQINGYWDGGVDGYNTQDPWATYILIKRMKYVCVNVKFPEAGKYWYAGKDLGLSQSLIDSIPAHPTTTMLKNWFRDFFVREGLADSPAVLWFFNNKLWKNAVKKRENGTITTGDDYDFVFITEHDWPAYGATLVGKMKQWIGGSVVVPPLEPPVISFPVGTGISSAIPEAIKTAGQGREVIIADGLYNGLPNIDVPVGVSVKGRAPGVVKIIPSQKRGWIAGDDNSDAWLKLNSTTRVSGGQTIANLVIQGDGAIGGILVNNRDNVTLQNIEVSKCNFFGVWTRYAKGLKANKIKLTDNSFAYDQYASGEFCYCELNQFDISEVEVISTVGTRGYGFKALWGTYNEGSVQKFRNLYGGRFAKLKTNMNHQSKWAGGASYNIGFELHGLHILGDLLFEDCVFENQFSLHSPTDVQPGKIRVTRCTINGENDRYSIEGIVNNLEVDHCSFKDTSQFIFNGQRNIKVSNWNIHDNVYDQGSAPNTGWGGVFLFGAEGAENVSIRNNNIRKRSDNQLLKFQGTQGGVNADIETANTITNF